MKAVLQLIIVAVLIITGLYFVLWGNSMRENLQWKPLSCRRSWSKEETGPQAISRKHSLSICSIPLQKMFDGILFCKSNYSICEDKKLLISISRCGILVLLLS